MKRVCALFVLLSLMLSLYACAETSVDENADVALTFEYGAENICVELDEAEASKVIAILNGKTYDSIFSGVPSCGFSENISLKVGNQTFAIACDTCSYIQDLGNLKFFSVPKEDMNYIHSLFEAYGGYFPCI